MLSVLVLLAVYVLWDMGFVLNMHVTSWVERADELVLRFVPWQPVLAVGAGLAAYWALQALGRDRIAFWLVAVAVAMPHVFPAWSHNRIGWHKLLEFQEELVEDRSVYWDMTLFVGCLVGLVALHRIMGIKRQERLMQSHGVDPRERRLIMRHESLMLAGLIVAGLLVVGLMMAVAAVLARYDGLLDESSLALATVGGGAALLLALTLLLWFRGLREDPDEASSMRWDTTSDS